MQDLTPSKQMWAGAGCRTVEVTLLEVNLKELHIRGREKR